MIIADACHFFHASGHALCQNSLHSRPGRESNHRYALEGSSCKEGCQFGLQSGKIGGIISQAFWFAGWLPLPFSFEFDAANGLLQGRLWGRVTSDELKDYYRTGVLCVNRTHPRAGITDMIGVTMFEVTPQTIRELAGLRPVPVAESLLRVIVASSPDIFGMARIFESHGEASRPNLHVVRTAKEALAIVGVPEPSFAPIDLASLSSDAPQKE